MQLLKTTVISATIQSLQDDQNLSSWAHEGIGLHDSYGAMQCLFCEQTLPQDRLDNLKAHFNAEYEHLLKNIDEQIKLIKQAARDSESIVLPHGSQFYEDLGKGYEDALGNFKSMQDAAKQALSVFVNALTEKKGQIFESSTLDRPPPELSVETVKSLNRFVRQHNSRCDEFEVQRRCCARDSLATGMVAGALEEYASLTKRVSESQSRSHACV